tara:strand:- start:458 stop:1273 length:816 start_codon:yes stop_codon:yes gene_type:complete
MIENSSIWIVTDVDGTLMDHNYDFSPAKETINKLKKLKIPVVLCTSKTASEVKLIRNELNINDPYIVENGGAIYGESKEGNKWEIILGESYAYLEKILQRLSKDVNFQLRPLNDLSEEEATILTGLSGQSQILMRDRHWSMPFLNPPSNLDNKLKYFCEKYNVEIFRGNRMSHLLSINSNKGKAIKKLVKFSKSKDVKIIGLGDSPNDLPLLKNSDYKIVISGVKGPNKKLIEQLDGYKYVVSTEPNGYGWKKEVIKLVNNLVDVTKVNDL